MDPINDIPGLKRLIERADGGAPDTRIAIIDGPVDPAHPAFAGRTAGGQSPLMVLSSEGNDTNAKQGAYSAHGTHVASIIAGQPGSPISGIAPGCTFVCIPVYREDGHGNLISCSQTTLARAIHYALDNGASLINISGGQLTPTGQGDRFLEAAVSECARRNVLILAAAGNDGCRCLHVPAALPTVLSVGACDQSGTPMHFSNYGDAYRDNGILAPGDGIPGAGPGGSIEGRSGTSFATPIVTGVAALLLGLQRQLGGEADGHAVRQLLLDTATPLDPQSAGTGPAGVLNVEAAMAALQRILPSGTERPSRISTTHVAAVTASSSSAPSNNQHIGEANLMSENFQTSGPAPAAILGPDGNPMAAAHPSGVNASQETDPAGSNVVPSAEAPAPAPAAATVTPAADPAAAPPQVTPWMQSMPLMIPQGFMPGMMMPQAYMPQAMTPQAMAGYAGGAPMPAPASAVVPNQSCGCGGVQSSSGIRPSQAIGDTQIFVIGRLFYDFESEARFDYFVQAIAEWHKEVHPESYDSSGDYAAPWNPEIMIRFLLYKQGNEYVNVPDANALIWTLNIDTAPIYAIKPQDAFGYPMYAELLGLLWQQETGEPLSSVDDLAKLGAPKDKPKEKKEPPVQRVSQAGNIDGEVRLMNGTVIPQLRPVWRGMYGWNIDDIAGKNPPEHFKEFLERIYNQFRNVGVSPQDRAMNYSAFNAYNTKQIFKEMAEHKPGPMFLDTVSVDRSTICRPDSDCWDATWTFFDPTATLTTARRVFQYTVDVSDIVPVTVGKLRDWMIF